MNCEEQIYSLQPAAILKMLVLKIHILTFNDAQIEFNDTQFA